MRLIAAAAGGVILGVLLFGPIKEYWSTILDAKVNALATRVENIEKFLTQAQQAAKAAAEKTQNGGKATNP